MNGTSNLEAAAHPVSVCGNHQQMEGRPHEIQVVQSEPCDHPALPPQNRINSTMINYIQKTVNDDLVCSPFPQESSQLADGRWQDEFSGWSVTGWSQCAELPSVLWLHWLSNRKDTRPVKKPTPLTTLFLFSGTQFNFEQLWKRRRIKQELKLQNKLQHCIYAHS